MKINSNGVTYHVEVYGEGEPLLLLHGFTGNYQTWSDIVEQLGSKYMCIMPDLIGHGQSDSPNSSMRYTIEAVAEDLKNILQSLQISKVNILGYSMGGRLALTFALLYKQYTNTLILESASPGLANSEEREKRKQNDTHLATKIMQDGIIRFIDFWQNLSLFESQKKLSDEKRNHIYKQRISNNEIGLANSLLGMGTGVQPSWWSQLNSLHMPVFLITGEYDEKFCNIANDMKEKLSYCEWQVVSRVGHAIHVENPEKFGKIVDEFVEKSRR